MVFDFSNPDWAMVGITIVYVVATIILCVINIHSNNLSKKLHDDRISREIMPYFKIEFEDANAFTTDTKLEIPFLLEEGDERDKSGFKITFKNVGLGTAINLWVHWSYDLENNLNIVLNNDVVIPNALTVGEEIVIGGCINHPSRDYLIYNNINEINLTFGISYDDLMGDSSMLNVEVTFSVIKNVLENHDVLTVKNYRLVTQKNYMQIFGMIRGSKQ